MTSRDTNCPAIAPLPAPNVLFAPNVTFATGDVNTFHDIVEASVSVVSGFTFWSPAKRNVNHLRFS